MSGLRAALATEWLKARRSRVPAITAAGFSLAPLVGGLFMLVLKDPERARSMGLVGAKARLMGTAADWPTYLGLLTQATAIGGVVVFGIAAVWVFGREFSERTAKDLLALPTSRAAIVGAKFVVLGAWFAALVAMVVGLGLGVGWLVGLPGWSAGTVLRSSAEVGVAGALTAGVVTPFALAASWGRGYLAPVGVLFLTLFASQILAAAGWGAWFPWSVPALYSGAAGSDARDLPAASYLTVALTALAGMASTAAWWRLADHDR
ncbi:MAG: ABC transporter permease [Actinomycetota bacterium]